MGDLIIAGHHFPVEWDKFVNYEENGWNATIQACVPAGDMATKCTGITPFGEKAKNRSPKRFSTRPALRRYGMNPPLEAAKAVIRQFVIHHDGLMSSQQCFHVLQNERGLSCHFLIDNDGTIYQTLDLALCGFHASEFNPFSVGVELANRGDANGPIGKFKEFYRNTPWYAKRPPKPIQIHGSKILAYDFTPEQYAAMQGLARTLTRLLPNLPVEYPQDVPGHQSQTTIPNPMSYSGYVGHYHLTQRKWDPGPFDFKEFCRKLRGNNCFPLWTGQNAKSTDPNQRPEIPRAPDDLEKRAGELYDANEKRADGGFFPVGPWGDSRLWHGGVHIPGQKGQLVFAPFSGRVVAARMGKESSVGSVNFVLLRHDMSVGPTGGRFYSLYMHLHDETKEATPPPWMTKEKWKTEGVKKKGEVVLLDEPVEAGEVIGRFGSAGPTVDGDDLRKAQIHWSIFAADPVFSELDDSGFWTVIDGSEGGRFCDSSIVLEPIDTEPADGLLSRRELLDFFSSSGDRAGMQRLITFHVSEWSPEPSWPEALRTPADFRAVDPKEIDALVEDQITPGLWWTSDVARWCKLPADAHVYHYHPVTFVRWINDKILISEIDSAKTATTVDESQTSVVTGMTSDLGEDSDGADMVSEGDLDPEAYDKRIENRHLIEGFLGEELLEEEGM
jgi:N-acetylmuramoyl-L-alanine amidase